MALGARVGVLGARISVIGAFLVLQACGTQDDTPAETGGSSGGDASSTGGRGGTGGTTGTGGSGGTGGTAGTGASGGGTAGGIPDAAPDMGPMGCTTAQYTHVSAFGSNFDGWGVATNSSPNLVPGPAPDGSDAASGTQFDLDRTDGSPVLGSAKLVAPFNDINQQLLFAQLYASGINLSGTTVSARVKLDSGLNANFASVGQAFIALKSTLSYIYVPGQAINLDSTAGWVTISINPDNPTASIPFGYTACDIREIDVIIATGGAGAFTTAVLHIDSIAILAGDAGLPDEQPDSGPADAHPDTSSVSEGGGADAAPQADSASSDGPG